MTEMSEKYQSIAWKVNGNNLKYVWSETKNKKGKNS